VLSLNQIAGFYPTCGYLRFDRYLDEASNLYIFLRLGRWIWLPLQWFNAYYLVRPELNDHRVGDANLLLRLKLHRDAKALEAGLSGGRCGFSGACFKATPVVVRRKLVIPIKASTAVVTRRHQ
jgi:hypothetical protein